MQEYSASDRLSRFLLPLVVGLYLLLAAAYSVTIPLGESADEVSHYGYVLSLLREGRLPAVAGEAAGEAHQPPLYYLMLAAVARPVADPVYPVRANPAFAVEDPATPNVLLHPRQEDWPYRDGVLAWHLMRLVSVALGAVTVWATYRLGRRLFPSDPAVAYGGAAALAFLPSFLMLHGVINNDTLIIALATLTLLQLVRMIQAPVRGRDGLVLGLLLGLAALTKLTGFLLWAPAGFAFVYLLLGPRNTSPWLNSRPPATDPPSPSPCSGDLRPAIPFALLRGPSARHPLRLALETFRSPPIAAALAATGVALVLILPWILYGWQAYGDPFAWSRFREVNPRLEPLSWNDAWLYITRMSSSFWAKFGGASQIELPDAAYVALSLLPSLAIAGWLRALCSQSSSSPSNAQTPPFSHSHTPALRLSAPFALLLVWELVLWGSHLRLWSFTLGMDQARQVFAGLPPLVLAMTWGLTRLWRNRAVLVATVTGAGMGLVALAALAFVSQVFAPQPVNAASLLTLGSKGPADFGGEIRVADYTLEPLAVQAGGQVTLTAYWQALKAPQTDYRLLLQISGPEGSVATQAGIPGGGRATTDRWRPGEVYFSRHTLKVPADLEPGDYVLELGLHPSGDYAWLPVRGRDTLPLARIHVPPPITLVRSGHSPTS